MDRDKTRIRIADKNGGGENTDEKMRVDDKTQMRKCGWRIKYVERFCVC